MIDIDYWLILRDMLCANNVEARFIGGPLAMKWGWVHKESDMINHMEGNTLTIYKRQIFNYEERYAIYQAVYQRTRT